jgi:hypothetical protein
MRKAFAVLVLVASVAIAAPALAAPGHMEGYIPIVAHTTGKLSSFWTTDVWIYQQGASVIHLWFNPAGHDNTNVQSIVIPLDQPVVSMTDMVANVFHTTGVGSVHYLADGPVVVVSRTWTPGKDGSGEYGQTVPSIPLTGASVAGTGQAGTLRMLVDEDNASRVNMGIVNVSPVAESVLVEIFTADGVPAPGSSSFTVNLQPFDMVQVNDVLSGLAAGQRRGLILRAGVSSAEGAIMSYVTTVNNTTNDSSYQEGFRFGF